MLYRIGGAAAYRDTTLSVSGGIRGLLYEQQLARLYVDQASGNVRFRRRLLDV